MFRNRAPWDVRQGSKPRRGWRELEREVWRRANTNKIKSERTPPSPNLEISSFLFLSAGWVTEVAVPETLSSIQDLDA